MRSEKIRSSLLPPGAGDRTLGCSESRALGVNRDNMQPESMTSPAYNSFITFTLRNTGNIAFLPRVSCHIIKMAAIYEYQKLTEPDAIRLIILEPSTDLGSPLQCALHSTSSSRCKRDLIDKYTALSYVWGDPGWTSLITVDGNAFNITASLDSVLRHLRDHTRKRHI
jgi:hypothetical protein